MAEKVEQFMGNIRKKKRACGSLGSSHAKNRAKQAHVRPAPHVYVLPETGGLSDKARRRMVKLQSSFYLVLIVNVII